LSSAKWQEAMELPIPIPVTWFIETIYPKIKPGINEKTKTIRRKIHPFYLCYLPNKKLSGKCSTEQEV